MKILKILLICILSLCFIDNVNADSNLYQVIDNNSGLIEDFDTYSKALEYFNKNKDTYDNLFITFNGDVINMEYGIVEFNIEPFIYHSVSRNENDYLSGSYGIDGAFLDYKDGNVYFIVSGDKGYTNIQNVKLHPIEKVSVLLSSYCIKNNTLYHNIKTQLEIEYFTNCLALDSKPSFLKEDINYYSYDGHYFYDDFYLMIDDYKAGDNTNSLNKEPYYNYYQFLPYRSISNYKYSEINSYLYNDLGIDGSLIRFSDKDNDGASDEVNRSQLYSNVSEYFVDQYLYGTNALMNIASSLSESSYGRSLDSYIKNNLYLNAAYETKNSKDNDRFDSIKDSIYSHSKYYISGLYGNYMRSTYAGTHFGNKVGGINIEYSLDHYYGEKVASLYHQLDNDLGLLDYNSKSIGIVNNVDKLNLYENPELSVKLKTLNNFGELSFVLLKEYANSYLVNIDYSFSNDYLYDFEKSVAYIDKNDISVILNSEKIKTYDLNKIAYDFNGGNFHGKSNLSLKVTNNDFEPYIIPNKDGYEFTYYESNMSKEGTLTYTANYRKIDHINILNLVSTQKELLPYIDLSKAYISVTYEDGSKNILPINTDMISMLNPIFDDAQTLYVTYNGVSASQDVQIDLSYYAIKDDIKKAINNGDYDIVKRNIDIVDYPLDMSLIRTIDYSLKQENKRNYVINDKTGKYNISVSGLDLSLDDSNNFNLIEDTYYVNVDGISSKSKEKIENVASGYNFESVDGINLSFKFNYQNINLKGPAIVQLDIQNKKNDYIYSVYHIDSNGDVIKCRTTQSNNFIQFVIYEGGDYLILTMPSNNIYRIDDHIENLSYENMGFDNNKVNIEFLLGLALILLSLIGILFYFGLYGSKEKQWKEYKRSLLKADTVQEEKLKN